MFPYLIAGAIGFVVAKIFESDDDAPKYADGGLIAPNGKPSNLTFKQYHLVRTPAFKEWFGDWENDPENSSKVVDSNGEPLPVYHGTSAESFDTFYEGSYFTDDYMNADGYASGEMIYEVFLNMKKPLIINARGRKWNDLKNKYGSSTQEIVSKLDDEKYDGIFFNNINDNWFDDEGEPQNVYYTINPEQIKLADGTNTTFDGNNPDIRFDNGGETSKLNVIAPKTDSAYDTQARRFILDFQKRNLIKKISKYLDKDGNIDVFIVYDKEYPSESNVYVTDSVEKAYDSCLNLDLEGLNIVRFKKKSNNVIYDYFNGDIFGDYSQDMYDDNGNLKQVVKNQVVQKMKNHFSILEQQIPSENKIDYKEKTYQVYVPLTQKVEGYFENKKEAEQFAKNFKYSIIYDIRQEEKVGKEFWFEYHCFESDESCDAEIWYRSHQKVKVVDVAQWSYEDIKERLEDANLRVYLVEWEDGFRYDVFEDELMESKDDFYRPDPPKRKDSIKTGKENNNQSKSELYNQLIEGYELSLEIETDKQKIKMYRDLIDGYKLALELE